MADLTELQATLPVKIAGANPSTGVEDNFLEVNSDGSISSRLKDGAGNNVTSVAVGSNQLLHTQTPDTTTSPANFGALLDSAQISLAGLGSAGFQLNAGTLIGTIKPQCSIDGGTSWVDCSFIDPASATLLTSVTFASANTLKVLSIIPVNGASHVKVVVSAYTSGTTTGLFRASTVRGPSQSITTAQIVSSLPAATITAPGLINAGVSVYTLYTATQNLAVKQFYAAGTGIGKQTLYKYFPTTTQFIAGGDFGTSGDVALWPWTSSNGTGSAALSTAQFFTGSHSVAVTFSNSSGTSAQGVKQTFSPVQDFSGWRYVTAEFYNVLSAGGAYTRTISIILTDIAGSTLKYDVSGLSTTTPFSVSGWIKITGEIVTPTSFTGTSFDLTQIASVELRMADSANKAGTVYWDSAKLETKLTSILPIFHQANSSINVAIDPVVVLAVGDQIAIVQTNFDTTRKEYFALVGGVAL